MNYNEENILLGLSGGINSEALACWLVESGMKPKSIHIFYAHFLEHSPDTFQFVADGIRLLKKHFENVHVKITKNSIINFFEEQNFIPHPANSPCSKKLKIEPASVYASSNAILIDLVGYVKHELKRRAGKQQKRLLEKSDPFQLQKHYPIGEFTDEWCFEIVEKHIGWYPKIYTFKWNDVGFVKYCHENLHRFPKDQQEDILRKIKSNERVFKHNNCLPCKNMYPHEVLAVEYFYPEYFFKAMQLSSRLAKYWGRNADEFYTTFGRDLGQESTCTTCAF